MEFSGDVYLQVCFLKWTMKCQFFAKKMYYFLLQRIVLQISKKLNLLPHVGDMPKRQ
jgi:hypothetical protein